MRRSKRPESGTALLFVLMAAAMIAIMLYAELPRVAFEGQRLKESDLYDRGMQYRRAIKLYVNRFNRYPPSMEALENTNNLRFLRRRFKDPMTGKAEWRLIHNVGGSYTDSLTMKPQTPTGLTSATAATDMASGNSAGTAGSGGSSADAQPTPPPRWQLQKGGQATPGDAAPPAADQPPDQTQQAAIPNALGADANPGATPPPQPGDPNYTGGGALVAGQPGDQQGQAAQPAATPLPPHSYRPPMAGYNSPLYPPSQLPGMPANLVGSSQAQGTDASGAAASASTSSSSVGMFGSSTVSGAGIAGVASTSEGASIRVYNKRKKYNEWEFIYDPKQEILGAGATMPAGQPSATNPQFGAQPGAGGMSNPLSPAQPTQPTQSAQP